LYYSQDLISGRTLVSVPYGTICDPLFDTPPQLSLLSDKLLDLGKRAGGAIEVRSMNGDCGALQSQGFGVSRCYWQHSVDLERDVQTIYASFHRSCVRQQIAKAEKSGFQSRIGCNEQDLRRFFRLFSGTRQSLGLPVLPWRFIDCLWHGLSEQRRIGIALSFVGSQAVAALLLLRFGKRVSAECLGWDRRFSAVGATAHVFWNAIKQAHQDGYGVFDFGRTASSNAGLMEFKARWGTTARELPIWYYPASIESRYAGGQRSFATAAFRHMSAHLPCVAFRALSDVVYRYLV
jgi:hypothetical protein